MSYQLLFRTELFVVLPLLVGCGAETNLVGDWEALEKGAKLVEFRFGADNRATIVEFMSDGARVLPTAGLATIENSGPGRVPGAARQAVSQFRYALDCNSNPCRLQLSGIGNDAGIELVYLVRFLISQELELRLLVGSPGRAGTVRIGPELLILHRLN